MITVIDLLLQKFFDFCEPAQDDEPKTMAVKVTPEMSPHDVMNIVINNSNCTS